MRASRLVSLAGLAITVALTALFMGVPLLLQPPSTLNVDTFQYLAIANYYLWFDPVVIRDVHTVGPVIPLLLAAAKRVAMTVTSSSAALDVALVKSVSFACYLLIAGSFMALIDVRRLGLLVASAALALLLLVLPTRPEFLSLNGELVCVALLCPLMVLACRAGGGWLACAGFALLATLTFYTKLQSVLLLALCCFLGADRRTAMRRILLTAGLVLVMEGVLSQVGGGWLGRASGLGTYLGTPTHRPPAIGFIRQAWRLLLDLVETLSLAQQLMPWVLGLLVMTLVSPRTEGGRLIDSFWLWLATSLLTIAIPRRGFEHYFVFLIPMVVLFSARLLSNRPASSVRWGGLLKPPATALLRHSSRGAMVLIAAILLVRGVTSAEGLRHRFDHTGRDLLQEPFISETAQRMLEAIPGGHTDLVVHGWDYRYYSALNRGSAGYELPFVVVGALSAQAYASTLLAQHPNYILDVVRHSGNVRDPALSLDQHPDWASTIGPHYRKLREVDGLALYQRN